MTTTSIKSLLIKLFKNKFAIENIDIDGNFFDHGINSNELAQLCVELSLAINKSIDILLFYEFPTISMLANELENRTAEIANEYQ